MTSTLAQLTSDLNDTLDEPVSGRYWTATQMTRWLNEGVRDVARRAEILPRLDQSISITAGLNKYTFPSVDVVRVHRIEYIPTGSTQQYPLRLSSINEMDAIWGIQQVITSSYPMYAILWGYPGNTNTLQIQLYPNPSQNGNLNIFYYGLPVEMVADADPSDIPTGWEDLAVKYAAYKCLQKGKDPRWQEFKALYEEALNGMIAKTREYHDQAGQFVTGIGAVPSWLFSFPDE